MDNGTDFVFFQNRSTQNLHTPSSLIIEDADMQVEIRYSWPLTGSDRNSSCVCAHSVFEDFKISQFTCPDMLTSLAQSYLLA